MAYPQATPMRPVPGAFMHTPAVASRFGSNVDPVRRRLFNEGSNHPTGGPLAGFSQNGFDAPAGPQQALQTVGQPVAVAAIGGQQAPTTTTAAQPQSPLAKAAGYVNNSLALDGQYPELDQYCKREFMWLRNRHHQLTRYNHRNVIGLFTRHRSCMGALQDRPAIHTPRSSIRAIRKG